MILTSTVGFTSSLYNVHMNKKKSTNQEIKRKNKWKNWISSFVDPHKLSCHLALCSSRWCGVKSSSGQITEHVRLSKPDTWAQKQPTSTWNMLLSEPITSALTSVLTRPDTHMCRSRVNAGCGTFEAKFIRQHAGEGAPARYKQKQRNWHGGTWRCVLLGKQKIWL